MLNCRFRYDGKPAVEMNRLQVSVKNRVDEKVKNGIYQFHGVPCCVCGGEEFEALSEKDRYGLYMSVVACRGCGLVQTNPRMSAIAYRNFYSQEYRKLYSGQEGPAGRFFMSQYKKAGAIYSYLRDNNLLGEDLRDLFVCEVGCAAGGVLQFFKEKRCRVFGIDLDETYLDYGRREYGLDLSYGTIFDVEFDRPPDLILYSHVLEHVLSPAEELMRLRGIISSRGMLYIQTPGVKNLHNSYEMDFLKFLQNAHTYHFTLTSLGNLSGACGFELVCGDEIIRSAWKASQGDGRKGILKDDYHAVISYLRMLENKKFARMLMGICGDCRRECARAAISVLKKTRMYDFIRNIYPKFCNRRPISTETQCIKRGGQNLGL